jgi:hypothetical protein
MLLGDLRTFRKLSPAYALRGAVFCWECTLCHKLFMPLPHDRPPSVTEVSRITAEFNQHDCAVQFAAAKTRSKRSVAA